MEQWTVSKFKTEYIKPIYFHSAYFTYMQNIKLDELQVEIKIARRNINNLRYTDDTTLMAEAKKEINGFLMKVKQESEKAGLKFNIEKTKIMTSAPISS